MLEAGAGPAAAVRAWARARLFSSWRYTIDRAARRLLDAAGWSGPDPEALPTGGQLTDDYLRPFAGLPALEPRVRYDARVVAATRSTAGRRTPSRHRRTQPS